MINRADTTTPFFFWPPDIIMVFRRHDGWSADHNAITTGTSGMSSYVECRSVFATTNTCDDDVCMEKDSHIVVAVVTGKSLLPILFLPAKIDGEEATGAAMTLVVAISVNSHHRRTRKRLLCCFVDNTYYRDAGGDAGAEKGGDAGVYAGADLSVEAGEGAGDDAGADLGVDSGADADDDTGPVTDMVMGAAVGANVATGVATGAAALRGWWWGRRAAAIIVTAPERVGDNFW
jgi:hypothetical protein